MTDDESMAVLEQRTMAFAEEVDDLLIEYTEIHDVPKKVLLAELEYIVGCEREEME